MLAVRERSLFPKSVSVGRALGRMKVVSVTVNIVFFLSLFNFVVYLVFLIYCFFHTRILYRIRHQQRTWLILFL